MNAGKFADAQSIGNGATANAGEFTDAQSIGNGAMEDATTENAIATGVNLPAATDLDLSPAGGSLSVAVHGGGPFDNLPVVGGSVTDPGGMRQISLLRMPPGLAIEIGAIENDEPGKSDDWSLTSGAKWKAGETSTSGEELMIQTLTDESFTKVCVDSGAGESVCPVDAFPSYETKKTAKTGTSYTAAGGQALVNVGEKRPEFKTNGVNAWMAFQATTGLTKPLAAATRITEKGNGIWWDGVDSESYIINKKSGAKIPLTIENGVYMMQMLVKSAAPFQGQVKP